MKNINGKPTIPRARAIEIWNAMTPDERRAVALRNPSMREARWSRLVDAMASSRYEQLTSLQADAIPILLAMEPS